MCFGFWDLSINSLNSLSGIFAWCTATAVSESGHLCSLMFWSIGLKVLPHKAKEGRLY